MAHAKVNIEIVLSNKNVCVYLYYSWLNDFLSKLKNRGESFISSH